MGLVDTDEVSGHGPGLLDLASSLAGGLWVNGEAVLAVPFNDHDALGGALVSEGFAGAVGVVVIGVDDFVVPVVLASNDGGVVGGLLVDGVFVSLLLEFTDGSFVGESPGGGEFFGRFQDVPFGGDVVELFSVVNSAETSNAVLVGVAEGKLDAGLVVQEFKSVWTGDKLEFLGGENVDLEDDGSGLGFVFVVSLFVKVNFLSVDSDGAVSLSLGWNDGDDRSLGVVEGELNFLGVAGGFANQNREFLEGLSFLFFVGLGNRNGHYVPVVAQVSGVGLVVEGLGLELVNGTVSCN